MLTGIGAATRLFLAGRNASLLGWLAGAVFLPSLALALGIWSGSGKPYEGLLTALWYIGPMNRTPVLDFTGAANGQLTLRYTLIYLALTAALLTLGFSVGCGKYSTRTNVKAPLTCVCNAKYCQAL